MILFTKEVLIQLKTLHNIHVNVNTNAFLDDKGKECRTDTWQVFIQGTLVDGQPHQDQFQTYINVESREKAYSLYKELAQQVVDSGEIEALNRKLIDGVLGENS